MNVIYLKALQLLSLVINEHAPFTLKVLFETSWTVALLLCLSLWQLLKAIAWNTISDVLIGWSCSDNWYPRTHYSSTDHSNWCWARLNFDNTGTICSCLVMNVLSRSMQLIVRAHSKAKVVSKTVDSSRAISPISHKGQLIILQSVKLMDTNLPVNEAFSVSTSKAL